MHTAPRRVGILCPFTSDIDRPTGSRSNISNSEEVGYSESLRAGVAAGAFTDEQNNGKMSHAVCGINQSYVRRLPGGRLRSSTKGTEQRTRC
jgi:hypothetical protein